MGVNKSLIKGSLILLISFGIYNFFNFLFQFSMARSLSVTEFGVLSTLFAIIYVFGSFSESIQVMIAKYSANQKDEGKLKNIVKRALKKSFLISLFVFASYLVAAIFISSLTKIDYLLVSFTGLTIFYVFLAPVNRGVLQGKRRFKLLGLNMIIESVLKLILAVTLVFFGWKVYGAIFGLLIGVGVAFVFSFFAIKDILKQSEAKADTRAIYKYSIPSFFIVLTILTFYSLDVFIARIFFSAEIAGSYAIASLLSKTIFFGTSPISKAMFPISAEKSLGKKKSIDVFINAFVLVVAISIAALILFYLFPNIIIKFFSGKNLIESAQILFFLGIATSILSLTNLILLYKLSTGNIKGYKYLGLFVVLEIFLLSYFSKNLFQFSIAFITASAIFLWGSIVFLNHN